MVDRNIQFAFMLIDQIAMIPPEMERDKFWHQSVPKELPYTIAALPFRHETDMSITDKDGENPAPLFQRSRLSNIVPEIRKISSSFSILRKISSSASMFSNILGPKTKMSVAESVATESGLIMNSYSQILFTCRIECWNTISKFNTAWRDEKCE